ncbi:hypothetical protein W97_00790 [Coniosporium apollinis CBS 100218]|uniref:Uncharacterized protein n=1 Tax=Coniosporium apollinis (strain CBS 100218) TaxID=1168221 RepID=R7YI58_CONA1|nr:uncharacterized protein W97_00790 [Coniosporium apollinis CBS 100218]EON61575.1 hypothetical protein W97_00790 [Coniosporium apollinis CBS 100218]
MASARYLFTRDIDSSLSPLMVHLLIALLVLVIIALTATAILYVLKAVRRSRKDAELPMYNEKPVSKTSNHRRLTITATPYGRRPGSVLVYQEKQSLIANSSSPPPSPVPEIRITFPDEIDESGKKQSGRVVVVRVGEQSVGLEPLPEDLPPYQRTSSDRFQSLDLERIGGLKEKL